MEKPPEGDGMPRNPNMWGRRPRRPRRAAALHYCGGGDADASLLLTEVVVTGGGVGVVLVAGGGAVCSVFTRVSMPFSWRLRISQRKSFDSLIPIRMSLIDSYTDGSLISFPAVPCP